MKLSLSEDYKDAIMQGKSTKARIMMKDSLLLDTTGCSFDEMLIYAKEHVPDIIDNHDGEQFKPSSDWDEDYLNEQMVSVVNNFSEERICLLKDMVKQLFEKKNEKQEDLSHSSNMETDCEPYSVPEQNGVSCVKVIGGGLVAVGAVTLVGGLAFHAPIWVPIAGGAAIGVGAYLLLQK